VSRKKNRISINGTNSYSKGIKTTILKRITIKKDVSIV
jgi:hypothetical protein